MPPFGPLPIAGVAVPVAVPSPVSSAMRSSLITSAYEMKLNRRGCGFATFGPAPRGFELSSVWGEIDEGEAATRGWFGSGEEGDGDGDEPTAGNGTESDDDGDERMLAGRSGDRFANDDAELVRGDLSTGAVAAVAGLVEGADPTSPGGSLFASFSSASASFFPNGPNPNAPPPADVDGGLISPAEVGGDPPLNVVELPPGEAARRSSPPDERASMPSTESGENDRE